jgi:hypothetical protein
MRGARQAGPEPAQAVEIDRKVHRDGHVFVDGSKHQVGMGYAGTAVTMRLDGHLMQAPAAERRAPRRWKPPEPGT